MQRNSIVLSGIVLLSLTCTSWTRGFQHPGIGRFLQRDPVGYADATNSYAAYQGDPIGRTDPTGYWTYTVNEGPKFLDNWTADYYIALDMHFPADRPKNTAQFWQVNAISQLGIDANCNPINKSKVIVDVYPFKENETKFTDYVATATAKSKPCVFFEVTTRTHGFAPQIVMNVPAGMSTDDPPYHLSQHVLSKMVGPKGTQVITYAYWNKAACCACGANPGWFAGEVGETLSVQGVGTFEKIKK